MAIISVTRLRVRSWRFLPWFLFLALRSARQAKRSPGNLGVRLLRDLRSTFWTLTAWEDEATMRAFMISGVHRQAMPKLLDWCDEAALAHWDQETTELPSPQKAHRQLNTVGRTSKVRRPSPDQQAKRIAEPAIIKHYDL